MHLANNDPCINPIRHFAYPEPRSSVASLTSRRRGNIKLRLSHLEKDGALALRLGGLAQSSIPQRSQRNSLADDTM